MDHFLSPGIMTSKDVKKKITQLEKRFKKLKKATRVCLERRKIPIKQIVDALTELPADDKDEHKLFLKRHLAALYNKSDHCELFGNLNVLNWNYLSYHLLEHLIKEFDLEVKNDMEAYKTATQQFREETLLTLFCQTQTKRHIKPSQGFQEMVAEFHWPDTVTLEVVEQFRQEYAYHYGLRECAMMIAEVRPGSFVITWLIPESIVGKLKVKIPRNILSKHSVTKLEISGACVYNFKVSKIYECCKY